MSDRVSPHVTKPTVAAWESSANLARIAELLRAASTVVVLTHSKPDGDAIGSTLALARTLAHLHIKAVPVYLNPWSPRFDELVKPTRVIHEHRHTWDEPFFKNADAVAICDTGSWTQLADARAWLEPRADRAVLIDHHAHGDPGVADHRYIDTAAAAACEIMADLCARLLNVNGPRNLPLEVAEPLYLGVATDTGWFRHSGMSSRTMRLAADLIDAGVDHNRIYRTTEQAERPERLRILERALRSLEFVGQSAVISLSQRDLAETGATLDEAGGLNDLPMSVASVRVSAVLIETEDHLTKTSFRSKAGDQSVDVNTLAQTLGGGGHFHAAGAKLRLPLAEARAKIIEALKSAGAA